MDYEVKGVRPTGRVRIGRREVVEKQYE